MELSSNFMDLSIEESMSIDGGFNWVKWGTVVVTVGALVGAAAITGPVGVIVGVSTAVGGGMIVGAS